jgi:hypothetical protein
VVGKRLSSEEFDLGRALVFTVMSVSAELSDVAGGASKMAKVFIQCFAPPACLK